MKRLGIIKGSVVLLAVLGLCLPQPLLAAVPAVQMPVAIDVALEDGGILIGQVVDPQGIAQIDVPVALSQGDQEIATAKTDAQGFFAFRGLRGGVYQLAAADGAGMYRLWAPRTAPPTAQRGALIVSGQDMARGQYNWYNWGGRLKAWLSNPWVIAGIVATAVAVPVAIHNADTGPSSP
jgi:hypothetical protein